MPISGGTIKYLILKKNEFQLERQKCHLINWEC